MGNDNTSNPSIDKQRETKAPVAGFNVHPENINRAGRPKRKTLTELIHTKLDDTPEAWNAVVGIVLEKILKEKDKDILKVLWQYTDGMPKQSMDLTSDGKPLPLLTGIADVPTNNSPEETPEAK